MELVIFLIGLVYLLRWTWFGAKTVHRILFGSPVTLERYGGKGVWAVVTGSTDGIGKAVALELAARGFNLILISRNIEKLNATALQVQEKGKAAGGVQTRVVAFDFSQDLSLEAYSKLAAKFADLDVAVLVNNVGFALSAPTGTLDELFDETSINTYPIVLLT